MHVVICKLKIHLNVHHKCKIEMWRRNVYIISIINKQHFQCTFEMQAVICKLKIHVNVHHQCKIEM
jgi:hypothetical protein